MAKMAENGSVKIRLSTKCQPLERVDSRTPRSGVARARRLARWQLRDIDRAARDARAAGDRSVKLQRGVVRFLCLSGTRGRKVRRRLTDERGRGNALGGRGDTNVQCACACLCLE